MNSLNALPTYWCSVDELQILAYLLSFWETRIYFWHIYQAFTKQKIFPGHVKRADPMISM